MADYCGKTCKRRGDRRRFCPGCHKKNAKRALVGHEQRTKLHWELIIPDCHIPYEDPRAYALMLQAGQEVEVDGITLLGDFADFYSVSSHPKSPDMEQLLRLEVGAVNDRLDELDHLFPKAKKTYIEGNHEWRLQRYLNERCPALFGLVDTAQLLGLHDRKNWTFHPFTNAQSLVQIDGSKLFARHEPITGGHLPSYMTVMRSGRSIVFGHIHTSQSAQVVMADGTAHIGASLGWLGDKTHPAFDYVKGHHQWSLGFGLVAILESGDFFLDNVRIIDYKAVVHGKLLEQPPVKARKLLVAA